MVPKLKKNSSGVSWLNQTEEVDPLELNGFYIAKPGIDNAATINKALTEGKNLLFSPGIYPIGESLKVNRPGTLVMGMGMATLVPTNGNPVMEISDVDRVTVCGLIFDAGKLKSKILLQVGEPDSKKNHAKQPSFLYDLFFQGWGTCRRICKKLFCHQQQPYLCRSYLDMAGGSWQWSWMGSKQGRQWINRQRQPRDHLRSFQTSTSRNTRRCGMAMTAGSIFTRVNCLTIHPPSMPGNTMGLAVMPHTKLQTK